MEPNWTLYYTIIILLSIAMIVSYITMCYKRDIKKRNYEAWGLASFIFALAILLIAFGTMQAYK